MPNRGTQKGMGATCSRSGTRRYLWRCSSISPIRHGPECCARNLPDFSFRFSFLGATKSPHRKPIGEIHSFVMLYLFALLVLVDVEASHYLNALPSLNEGMCMSLKTYRFHDRSCIWICIHCTPRFPGIDKLKRGKSCRGMHRGEICKEKTRLSRVPITIVRTTLIKQCTQCPVEPFRKTIALWMIR